MKILFPAKFLFGTKVAFDVKDVYIKPDDGAGIPFQCILVKKYIIGNIGQIP